MPMRKNKNQNGSRLSISQARKALGMVAKNYSDEDVVEILHLLKEAAEYTYEEYVIQEVPNKNR